MAGSLNRASLIGHVGGDPEIKATQSGRRFANLSIATSESWTDKGSGEKKERTEWHRIVVWGGESSDGLVGVLEKYVKKGSKLFIEGAIRTRQWESQTGEKHYSTEIVINSGGGTLLLLDRAERAPGQTDADAPPGRSYAEASGRGEPARSTAQDLDDEIPF